MGATSIRRARFLTTAGVLAAVGGWTWLYFSPLIITGRDAHGVTRSSAWVTGDRFALLYGGVGLFFGVIGLGASLLAGRAGYVLAWVSGAGLGAVSWLAFVATFGEPRLSAVFVPAAGLLLWSASARPAPVIESSRGAEPAAGLKTKAFDKPGAIHDAITRSGLSGRANGSNVVRSPPLVFNFARR